MSFLYEAILRHKQKLTDRGKQARRLPPYPVSSCTGEARDPAEALTALFVGEGHGLGSERVRRRVSGHHILRLRVKRHILSDRLELFWQQTHYTQKIENDSRSQKPANASFSSGADKLGHPPANIGHSPRPAFRRNIWVHYTARRWLDAGCTHLYSRSWQARDHVELTGLAGC